MTRPFLSIRGIGKFYGAVAAVQDVSLDVAEGEFVTFLGPSGSGRSTTLHAIAGSRRRAGLLTRRRRVNPSGGRG